MHHGEHLNAAAVCSLVDSANGSKGRASIHVVADLDTLRSGTWDGTIERTGAGNNLSMSSLRQFLCMRGSPTQCWADEKSDRPDKGSNVLIGTYEQITDNLKRLNEAGLTMPQIWPRFTDVPVSKTMDDLKQLNEEILQLVNTI